jgi:hypothetical protein
MQDDRRARQSGVALPRNGGAAQGSADKTGRGEGLTSVQQAFNKRSVLQVPRRQARAGLAVIADGR